LGGTKAGASGRGQAGGTAQASGPSLLFPFFLFLFFFSFLPFFFSFFSLPISCILFTL
jgi:hypothetical protein